MLAGVPITIDAKVEELLVSLGLTEIPPGCELKKSDVVEVRGAADEDDLILPNAPDEALEPDQTAVMELVAAIRRGSADEAEAALDRLFDGSLKVREWVQQTHSRAAAA